MKTPGDQNSRRLDPESLEKAIARLERVIEHLDMALQGLEDPKDLANLSNALSNACQRLGVLFKAYHHLKGDGSNPQDELQTVLKDLGKA